MRRMGRRRVGLATALGALLALGGCRGCGCEAPETASDPGGVDAITPTALDPAQSMGPDEVERAITEGLRAVAARDPKTAIARFEAAAAADPARRVPHQRLCGLYRQAERIDDALRACRAWRALEAEPDFQRRADAIIEALAGVRQAGGE